MNTQHQRLIVSLSILLFGLLLLAQAAYCFLRPMSSIDSLAYISVLDGGSPEAFREAMVTCNAQIKGEHNGCEDNDLPITHEISHYSDSDFATFLRFYRVKPLYTWCAGILHRDFHFSGYVALRTVSAASYFVIGVVLLLWLCQHLSIPIACLMSLLIACTRPVLALGKDLRPDGFSTALLVCVLFAILYLARALWLQLILLALLPVARPDNILFSVILGAVLIYRATPDRTTLRLRLAGLAAVAALLNWSQQTLTHALSYTVLFNHTFLTWTPPRPIRRYTFRRMTLSTRSLPWDSRPSLWTFPCH